VTVSHIRKKQPTLVARFVLSTITRSTAVVYQSHIRARQLSHAQPPAHHMRARHSSLVAQSNNTAWRTHTTEGIHSLSPHISSTHPPSRRWGCVASGCCCCCCASGYCCCCCASGYCCCCCASGYCCCFYCCCGSGIWLRGSFLVCRCEPVVRSTMR
jgi:hypothetical protein